MDNETRRFRFYEPNEDPRPVLWPLPNGSCYWITGQECGGRERHTIVVYIDSQEQLLTFWPEAEDIEDQGPSDVHFNGRFPRPDYFIERAARSQGESEMIFHGGLWDGTRFHTDSEGHHHYRFEAPTTPEGESKP